MVQRIPNFRADLTRIIVVHDGSPAISSADEPAIRQMREIVFDRQPAEKAKLFHHGAIATYPYFLIGDSVGEDINLLRELGAADGTVVVVTTSNDCPDYEGRANEGPFTNKPRMDSNVHKSPHDSIGQAKDLTFCTIAAASIPYLASSSSGLPERGSSFTASL